MVQVMFTSKKAKQCSTPGDAQFRRLPMPNGNQATALIYIALMFLFIFAMTSLGKSAELIPTIVG